MSKHPKHIEVIVRGVLVKENKVLLCHTKKRDNTYLPGGHIDPGESASVALVREIREELGVKATAGRFLGAVEHHFKQDGKPVAEVNFVFEFRVPGWQGCAVPESCEDYIEFRWVPLNRLRAARLEPAPLCRLLPRWLKTKSAVGWASTY